MTKTKKIFIEWLSLTLGFFVFTSLVSIKFPLALYPIKGFGMQVGFPLPFFVSENGAPWPGGFYRRWFLLPYFLVDLLFWGLASFLMIGILRKIQSVRRKGEKI